MKKAEMNRTEMPLPNRKIFDLAAERTAGNVSALADMIGVKQQSLDRLFKIDKRSGKYPSVSPDIKKALKDKLGIDEIYLLTTGDITQSGGGNTANTGNETVNNTTNNYRGCGGADEKAARDITTLGDRVTALEDRPSVSYTRGKPYYNVDFIGGFDLVLNDQTINPDYLIDFKKYEEADYWCNITGHSMEPLISNGDIIALKQLNGWRDFLLYGEVYGVVTDEMRTVKIVTKSEKGDDYLQLVPVNKSPEYQPQDIPVRLITHILQVLGCMKKL